MSACNELTVLAAGPCLLSPAAFNLFQLKLFVVALAELGLYIFALFIFQTNAG